MKIKGISYDVGRVMGGNWRPDFDLKIIHRELEIIKNDLHCNTVRICGLDINRLTLTAEDALKQGLKVWLSPEMWDKSQEATLKYMGQAASAAATLCRRWQDDLVFVVGSELTLFMPGIIEGRTLSKRLRNPSLWDSSGAEKRNLRLNAFLSRANEAVRKVFPGRVSYASLAWESVDWNLFDFAGVDHYRDARIKDRYVEMLQPLFGSGKPVVITEFGMRGYQSAESSGTLGFGIADYRTVFFNRLPLLGRFVRPRIKGNYLRDEGLPAHELTETLGILDDANVEGAFVMTFVQPLDIYDEDPRYDLDMNSFSLVKSYSKGRHGATYPDMPWEPKQSFRAVADYYLKH